MSRVWNILPMAACGAMTVVSIFMGNAVGAAAFSLMTLTLLWWTVRPARRGDKTVHPLRLTIGAATVVSAVAGLEIAVGISDWGTDSAGLAVVGASITVPVAGFFWWWVRWTWKVGYRWSTTVTHAEMAKWRADQGR